MEVSLGLLLLPVEEEPSCDGASLAVFRDDGSGTDSLKENSHGSDILSKAPCRDDFSVPTRRRLRSSTEVLVQTDEAERLSESVRPFEIIHEGPHKIPFDRNPLLVGAVELTEIRFKIDDAGAVVYAAVGAGGFIE
jgi:hypothetical protein